MKIRGNILAFIALTALCSCKSNQVLWLNWENSPDLEIIGFDIKSKGFGGFADFDYYFDKNLNYLNCRCTDLCVDVDDSNKTHYGYMGKHGFLKSGKYEYPEDILPFVRHIEQNISNITIKDRRKKKTGLKKINAYPITVFFLKRIPYKQKNPIPELCIDSIK